jgi:hypothetical protein
LKLVIAICIVVLVYLVAPAKSAEELIGPYSGTVLDATTGKPVEGALVLFYWRKRIPNPIGSSSDLIDAKLISTIAAGKYDLPVAFANTGLSGVLDSTHVIIYQPGYKAYIKLIWHNSPYATPDREFQNKGNVIKLERIPPDFDHNAHYRRIEDALEGLYRYDYSEAKNVSFKQTPIERDQFLRRAEWEQRRPGKEGRK